MATKDELRQLHDRILQKDETITPEEFLAYCKAIQRGKMDVKGTDKAFVEAMTFQVDQQLKKDNESHGNKDERSSKDLRSSDNNKLLKVSQFKRYAMIFNGNLKRQERKIAEAQAKLSVAVAEKNARLNSISMLVNKEPLQGYKPEDMQTAKEVLQQELDRRGAIGKAFSWQLKKRINDLEQKTTLDAEMTKRKKEIARRQYKIQQLQSEFPERRKENLQKQIAALDEIIAEKDPAIVNEKLTKISEYLERTTQLAGVEELELKLETLNQIQFGNIPNEQGLTREQMEAHRAELTEAIEKANKADLLTAIEESKTQLQSLGLDHENLPKDIEAIKSEEGIEALKSQRKSLQEMLDNVPDPQKLTEAKNTAEANLKKVSDPYKAWKAAEKEAAKINEEDIKLKLDTLNQIQFGNIPNEQGLSGQQIEELRKDLNAELDKKAKLAEEIKRHQDNLKEQGFDISNPKEIKKAIKEKGAEFKKAKGNLDAIRTPEQIQADIQAESNKIAQLKTEIREREDLKNSDDPHRTSELGNLIAGKVDRSWFGNEQQKILKQVLKEAPTSEIRTLRKVMSEKEAELKDLIENTTGLRSDRRAAQRELKALQRRMARVDKKLARREKRFKRKQERITKKQDRKITKIYNRFLTFAGRMQNRDETLAKTTTMYKALNKIGKKVKGPEGIALVERYKLRIKEQGLDLSTLPPEDKKALLSILAANDAERAEIAERLGLDKKKEPTVDKDGVEHIDVPEVEVPINEQNAELTPVARVNNAEVLKTLQNPQVVELEGIEKETLHRDEQGAGNNFVFQPKLDGPEDELAKQCEALIRHLQEQGFENIELDKNLDPKLLKEMYEAAKKHKLEVKGEKQVEDQIKANEENELKDKERQEKETPADDKTAHINPQGKLNNLENTQSDPNKVVEEGTLHRDKDGKGNNFVFEPKLDDKEKLGEQCDALVKHLKEKEGFENIKLDPELDPTLLAALQKAAVENGFPIQNKEEVEKKLQEKGIEPHVAKSNDGTPKEEKPADEKPAEERPAGENTGDGKKHALTEEQKAFIFKEGLLGDDITPKQLNEMSWEDLEKRNPTAQKWLTKEGLGLEQIQSQEQISNMSLDVKNLGIVLDKDIPQTMDEVEKEKVNKKNVQKISEKIEAISLASEAKTPEELQERLEKLGSKQEKAAAQALYNRKQIEAKKPEDRTPEEQRSLKVKETDVIVRFVSSYQAMTQNKSAKEKRRIRTNMAQKGLNQLNKVAGKGGER